jgi:hypothetical protein
MSTDVPDSIRRSERREIRVCVSTYVIFGLLAALIVGVGVSGLGGKDRLYAALLVGFGVLLFVYACLQKIEIDGDLMTLCRPFRSDQRFSLSSVTKVSSVWTGPAGRGGYKWVFRCGRTTLCEFSPKLFSREDLTVIRDAVRLRAPGATFED